MNYKKINDFSTEIPDHSKSSYKKSIIYKRYIYIKDRNNLTNWQMTHIISALDSNPKK